MKIYYKVVLSHILVMISGGFLGWALGGWGALAVFAMYGSFQMNDYYFQKMLRGDDE